MRSKVKKKSISKESYKFAKQLDFIMKEKEIKDKAKEKKKQKKRKKQKFNDESN